MIIRCLDKIIGTSRDVEWGNGNSRRFLIEKDGMSYSLTDTITKAGTKSLLEYKNHLEACYCIEGTGEVHDIKTGEVHQISPGTMYALNENDAHYLIAKDEDLRLVCVFSPALKGNESHKLADTQSSAY
ncbi:MAG TPA: L-ectoine synthase [Crenotrichaceae bacterium]|nr:L-ectoine synthase [Crenotrichaceae bacterium]